MNTNVPCLEFVVPLQYGDCPHCGCNLDGDGVWQTFSDAGLADDEADKIAEMYGANRSSGRWGRAISIVENDCAVRYLCPECQQEWPR